MRDTERPTVWELLDQGAAGSNVDLVISEGNCKVMKLSNETGEGVMTMYQVFDGVYLMFNDFHMEYIGTPVRVWAQFGMSFERSLIAVFELDNAASKTATSKAKRTFKGTSKNSAQNLPFPPNF